MGNGPHPHVLIAIPPEVKTPFVEGAQTPIPFLKSDLVGWTIILAGCAGIVYGASKTFRKT